MTPAKAAAAAREFSCGLCWQRPGRSCNHRGEHLARYMHAESVGLLSRGELAAVVARLEAAAPHVYVPVPVALGAAA